METDLYDTSERKLFTLKADLIPVSSLLIVIDTNRNLDKARQKFLEGGFKETSNKNRLVGTYNLKGTKFAVLIDFTDGLKKNDGDFQMQIAMNLNYTRMEEPANEKLKNNKLIALVKAFVSNYKIIESLREANTVKKGA